MCSLGRSLQLQHCGKTAAAVVTTYRITILVNYAIKFVHWGLMCLVYGYSTEVVDVDVDVGSAFSLSLILGYHFTTYCHSPGGDAAAALSGTTFYTTYSVTTRRRPWWSLCSPSALVNHSSVCCSLMGILLVTCHLLRLLQAMWRFFYLAARPSVLPFVRPFVCYQSSGQRGN